MAGNNPTQVNIGIGLDMSVMKQSMVAARSEIYSFVRDTKRAQTDLEKFNQKKGVVDALFGAKEISPQLHAKMVQYYKDLYNIEQGHNKAAAAAKRHAQASGGGFLSRNIGQFGTGVMAGFGVAGISSAASQAGQALGDFIADSVKLAMERQRISAAMEAMLGSEEAAQKLTKAMIQLDRQSMLTYGTISKGAQTLLGFGVAQEMVMPSLQALSKISLGNAERFQSLSLAFGQVAASGKLAGQEILQMVNAGFNPLQEIARVTGKHVSQLKADVEAGRVSFLQVAEAILTATEAGGRFEKISEKMLQTPAGMLAKLQSDFELIKADLGERLMPSMIAMFESIKDNEFVIESLATNIANLFDIFGFALALIQDYKNLMTIGDTGDPLKNFKKSSDFILQWEKRQEEMQKRRAEQKAQRDKKQAEEEAFNKLTPEERKKRLAEEQAKMDEFRADQQRAKSRAEMQKKIQDLEDGTDRSRYFREIGGHLAKTKEQIQLIADAMDEFDKHSQLEERAQRAKSLQDEINRMQEESNKLKKSEVDLLLQKYNLDKATLTKEEQQQKSRLLKAFFKLDENRLIDQGKKLEVTMDPMKQAQEKSEDLLKMLIANVGPTGTLDKGGLSIGSFQEQVKQLALEVMAKDKQAGQMDVTTKAITAGSAEQKIMVAKLNEQNARAAKAEQIQLDIRTHLETIAKKMGLGFQLVP